MSALAGLQGRLQRAVLEDRPQLAEAVAGGTLPPEQRVGIYARAYRSRLLEALEGDYPALRALLGAQDYARLALAYVEATPPDHHSIRWYGRRLPAFLAGCEPDRPWLAALAAFEWTMGETFDAAEAEPLAAGALEGVPAERWPQARLEFHPSLRSLALPAEVPALWRAALAGQLSPERPSAQAPPVPWLLWRREGTPLYRSAGPEEHAMLEALRAGGALAEGCEALAGHLAEAQVPLRAATLLRTWIEEGLVSALHA